MKTNLFDIFTSRINHTQTAERRIKGKNAERFADVYLG
jgi:hypothetical protein